VSIEEAKRFIQSAYPITYPVIFERAKGIEMWDVEGRRYLDFLAGIGVMNYGHSHPKIVKAVQEQIEKLSHVSMLYYNVPAILLAKKLAEIAPGDLRKTYYANSGTEAVESAIKLAKKYSVKVKGGTGSYIIAFDCAFHGRGGLTLTLTASHKYKKLMGHFANYPGVVHLPTPYCYRFPGDVETCKQYTLEKVDEYIKYRLGPENTAAVIIEPVIGEGGIIVPPDGWLKELEKICRENDVLLIVDEVQSGFGRTGKIFGHEWENVRADIMTMAKGLGAGLPLAGIMATEEVDKAWEPGDHNVTFSGNPVACAAALAGIEVLLEEKLHENALKVGNFIMGKLRDASLKSVGEVRGRGLFIGIEIVKEGKKPDPEATKRIGNEMFKRGYIMGTGGIFGNVVRIEPPLIVTMEQADKMTDDLIDVIKGLQ
jgi:4-aminobutyrate aminotransferase